MQDPAEADWLMWGEVRGATIIDDLGPAPWGAPLYGQLTDRFGVIWILDLAVAR